MFSNSVTTSQGSIQVLRNAWNLVASGVMLLLNVFLHIVYLCVRAVPMSVTIWMYISSSLGFRCVCICIRTWSFSGTSSPPLCCSSSSWYDVDYSVASPLRFGQCLGCDFAEKSCFSYGWVSNKHDLNLYCTVHVYATVTESLISDFRFHILVKSHITGYSASSTRCFLTMGIGPITNGMCPLREITI